MCRLPVPCMVGAPPDPPLLLVLSDLDGKEPVLLIFNDLYMLGVALEIAILCLWLHIPTRVLVR